MTVQTLTRRTDYIADGVQTVYAYDFIMLDDSHMEVYFDGVFQPSGFTVQGVGDPNGGTVTFAVAPGNGIELTLLRNVPFTQEIDYTEYDSFPAETHEGGLDLGVMRDQQLAEFDARALNYGIGDSPPGGTTLERPEPNQAIGYDSDGNLTNIPVGIGGTPVVNPLQEDLLSGGTYGFVATDDQLNELGRFDHNGLDAPNQILIDGININTLFAPFSHVEDLDNPHETNLEQISPLNQAGDILSFDGNVHTRIGVGLENQVFTIIGGLPTWAPSQGGGGDGGRSVLVGMGFFQEIDAAGQPSVDIALEAGFEYEIRVLDARPVINDDLMYATTSATGVGGPFDGESFLYSLNATTDNVPSNSTVPSSKGALITGGQTSTAISDPSLAIYSIINHDTADAPTELEGVWRLLDGDIGVRVYSSSSSIAQYVRRVDNAIRLAYEFGNFQTGRVRVYRRAITAIADLREGHIIENEAQFDFPQRTNLQFTGPGVDQVIDDEPNDRTIVRIEGGGVGGGLNPGTPFAVGEVAVVSAADEVNTTGLDAGRVTQGPASGITEQNAFVQWSDTQGRFLQATGTQIVSAQIANESVGNSKLENMPGNTFKGRQVNTGQPQDLTINNLPNGNTPGVGDNLLGMDQSGQLVRYPGDELPSGGGTDDHSALQNLDADDHGQYFNQVRGDARYAGLNLNNNFLQPQRFNSVGLLSAAPGRVSLTHAPDGIYDPLDGGFEAGEGQAILLGTVAQVAALKHSFSRNAQVHVTPEGELLPVETPEPAWSISATDSTDTTAGAGAGQSGWELMSFVPALDVPQDVSPSDEIVIEARIYWNNLATNASGSVSIGVGIDGAEPAQVGATEQLGSGFEGPIPTSWTAIGLTLTAGQTLSLYMRRESGSSGQFNPVAQGTTQPHTVTIRDRVEGGGGGPGGGIDPILIDRTISIPGTFDENTYVVPFTVSVPGNYNVKLVEVTARLETGAFTNAKLTQEGVPIPGLDDLDLVTDTKTVFTPTTGGGQPMNNRDEITIEWDPLFPFGGAANLYMTCTFSVQTAP